MIAKELRNVLSVLLSLALLTGSSTVVSGFQASTEQSPSEHRGADTSCSDEPKRTQSLGCADRSLPGQPGSRDTRGCDISRSGCDCGLLASAEQESDGQRSGQAVDKQSWDASVKGLTQFPSVLNNMAKSLSWTSQLGEAYHNQKSEVMSAIQSFARAGQSRRESQIDASNDSRAAIAANDRDSAGEPECRLRPAVQPGDDLWISRM